DATTSAAQWQGNSATAFTGVVSAVSSVVGKAEAPTNSLVGVIHTYADALDTAQKKIAAAAAAYTTAQTKANETADAVNANPNRTQADVDAANTIVKGYQKTMTGAEDDVTSAWKVFYAARDKAVKDASGFGGDLHAGAESAGAFETLKGINEKFHAVWDLTPADYLLGEKLAEAAGALPGVSKGAASAQAAAEALSSRVSALQALKDVGFASDANIAELATLSKTADAAAANASSLSKGASELSLFTKGMTGLTSALGVTAIAGDVFTIISPEDSGALGWVDRGAAATNAALVGTDLAMTAGVFGAEATIPVAGEVLMVGTAAYLAGDYLYHHWAPFKNVCDTVADTTVSVVKDVGQGVEDFGKGVANVASDVWNSIF
ncbi:MAG: hypothetical protein M3Y06_12255, partial [Actinomycetota bacterium]|nr:hypothetical protein [Actinomycetota bacterium]